MNRTSVNVLKTAEICHAVNRAHCQNIGDDSQPEWADAPEWQRQSAVNGVRYHLANPDSTPEDSHLSWLAEKEANGWVYGEEKDAEARTHPCFMPYDELPADQRAKDAFFLAVVRACA